MSRSIERKHAISLFVAFLLAATIIITAFRAIPSSQATDQAVLYVNPSGIQLVATTYPVGSTFSLGICIANVTNLYGYQYQLNWNNTILNAVGIHDNLPFPPADFFLADNTTTAGQMYFCGTDVMGPSGAVTGNFTVRTITFKIMLAVNPPLVNSLHTSLVLSNDILGDPDANQIPHSTVNGEFYYIASRAIYIMPDGSIASYLTAPIQRNRDVYTFTGNFTSDADGIVVERSNIVIDGAGYPLQGSGGGNGLALSGVSNVTIKHVSIGDFHYGIYLYGSGDHNIISGNNITSNGDGVHIVSSSYNIISGNNITSNGDGVHIVSSSYNIISGNNITSNGYGIYSISSSHNSISGNNITDGGVIWFYTCSNNGIYENNITTIWLGFSSSNSIYGNNIGGIMLSSSSSNSIYGNNIVGMYLDSSSGNSIFHNNFINTRVLTYGSGYANVWDVGYPLGGNYWSDSNKTDLFGGAGQNVTGNDGICDKSVVIDANNVDRYPLVLPYPSHDLAVSELAVSKTIVGKGSALVLSVTIVNEGDFRENVSFSVSFNSTVISNSTFSSPFEIRQSTTILLYPITANLAYGNYTIRVHVTPVAGEANLTNNDKSCWFFVTIPGDANGDKKVNVLDLILIATHLGIVGGNDYTPYTPDWYKCTNTDLNNDGQHNVLDLIICATHLGQHW